jgi:hypothetical protein
MNKEHITHNFQKQLTLQKKKRTVRSHSSHSFFTTMRAAVPVFAALSS